MTGLSSETKKKIAEAYAAFETDLRKIADEHRLSVSELLKQADEKYIDRLKERIEKES